MIDKIIIIFLVGFHGKRIYQMKEKVICDRLWENRPLRAQLQNRVIGIQG